MAGDSSSGNHLDGDEREMQALRASVTALEKKVDSIAESLQQLAASLNVPNEPIILEGNRGRRQNPRPVRNPPPPQNPRRIPNPPPPHFESEDDAGHRRPPHLYADSESDEEAENWALGANREKPKQWDLALAQAEFTFNSLPNRSTGKSPFSIVYLKAPNFTVDLLHVPGAKSKNAEELAEFVTQVHADVKAKLQQSNTKSVIRFDETDYISPASVFPESIDFYVTIASKRENLQREMEKRIVTQLMTCMDESHRFVQSNDGDSNSEASDQRPGYVLVIGATNRPDAVDPALRRPGRFDREIVLGVPDEIARVEILSVITRNLRVECSFDLLKIARSTPGFVGADLSALANKAGNLAMKRIIDQRKSEFSVESMAEEHSDEWWRQPWLPEEMEKLLITRADFEEASKMVQPAARREGFSAIPNVKWEEVGGLDYLRQEFERYIVRRIKFPEEYEVDALTTKRGKEGGWVVERLLNQLLIELDGADQRRGVFVIGATNRPDVMDRAVLRPGRFGKLLYVPLPTADERGLILKALARKKPIDANVDLCAVAQMKACESLSGADLSALMNEAAMAAWEEKLTATKSCPLTIKITHFERALSKITPSVSNQQRQRYQNLSESLKAA
ncbi:hypothetical protein LWI29_029680 [Acer saccharum]|uniref:Uncharacterized protein n=1 Tax=Acer saccharum TaxID=4024 RepID=A0AA39SPA8_ACESA|nr:hypothetical protein LWI29_029680 [Acer saccharum]